MSAVSTDIEVTKSGSANKAAPIMVDVPRALLIIALVPLVIMKLLYIFAMPVLPDEGYYWMWGQFPALSYFDHPPLLAWLQGMVHSTFGSTVFSLRLVPVIAFAGMAWIAWDWCKRLAPEGKALHAMLITLIVWFSSPLLLRFTSLAIQDCLLIVFTMASIHFVALFLVDRDDGETDWRLFFAACLCVGFAGLSKYNAVFVAVGFAVYLLGTRDGRGLLGSWQVWAGLALIALMQMPVVWWNVQHDWPSMQFHLADRIGETRASSSWLTNLQSFVIEHVQMLGPGMMLLMARFVFVPDTAAPLARTGVFVMLASTLAFAFLTTSNTVLVYWNMVAFAAVMPAVAFLMRYRAELLVHAAYGLTAGVWYLLVYGLYPLNAAQGVPVRDLDIQYGMSEVAQRLERLEAKYQPDRLMTSDYRTAGILGFVLDRNDIAKIGPRNDQYDFWFDPAETKGQSALILVDDALPETALITQVFGSVETVHAFTIRRYGYNIHSWRVVLAKDHCGCGPH
ncbi:MAG: glycosyltransferase family 39 protein [Pseudomonadota bacterium]